MYKIKLTFILVVVLGTIVSAKVTQHVLPTKAQLQWADSEIGVLIHFDMPVFEPEYDFRKDWNYHPDLSLFNPKELDTDQWIKAAKSAGRLMLFWWPNIAADSVYGRQKRTRTVSKTPPGGMAREIS